MNKSLGEVRKAQEIHKVLCRRVGGESEDVVRLSLQNDIVQDFFPLISTISNKNNKTIIIYLLRFND